MVKQRDRVYTTIDGNHTGKAGSTHNVLKSYGAVHNKCLNKLSTIFGR